MEVLDQACPAASIYLESESSVSGTLRTSDGDVAKSVSLELVRIDAERSAKGFSPGSFNATTDQSGNFRFDGIFPGRYLLGTNILFDKAATSTAPRAYYPGYSTRQQATEITVDSGTEVNGLQFILPDVGPRRTLRIVVVDDAGRQDRRVRRGQGPDRSNQRQRGDFPP